MKTLGPLLGVGLTIDWHLAVLLTCVNAAFASVGAALFFRRRPVLDRLLITLGLFAIFGVGSLLALHWFARTPVRDVQVFLVD